MFKLILIFLLLFQVGCASKSFESVINIVWIRDTAAIKKACGNFTGCTERFIGICIVYAPDPPLLDSASGALYYSGQWGTLGHEVKHCFDGSFHSTLEPTNRLFLKK